MFMITQCSSHQPVVTSGCFGWFNGVERTGVFSPLAPSHLFPLLFPYSFSSAVFFFLSPGEDVLSILHLYSYEKHGFPLCVVCSQSAVFLLSFKGDSSDVLAPLTPRLGSTQDDLWVIIKGTADSAVADNC